jgi:hypothetical protein
MNEHWIRAPALGLATALTIALLSTSCGGEASTESLCDDACTHWAGCDDAGTGYTWSYDDCFDTCQSEGDWDGGYVDCVLANDLCYDIEDC